MKLYRHYKNKAYKYIGEAKHSETLEDLVIYETLYENKLGKVWARPKEMFFDTVEVDGKTTPRFQPISVEIKETTDITPTHVQVLAPLIEKIFGNFDDEWVNSRLKNFSQFYLITAFIENQAVGFKLGYEQDNQIFYSWLGGVLPEYRGVGIASSLMKAQHEWCKKQGYEKIQTKTQNKFRDMLILNLQQDFKIVNYIKDDKGEFKIVMEKGLKAS